MAEQQPWVPLTGVDLLKGVRDILVANPERHDQSLWIGNYYLDPEETIGDRDKIPVDQIRAYMNDSFPPEPADMDTDVPPCGTTGCFFGWAGVLSAPAGSFITNGRIYLPGGDSFYLPDWVGPRLGFTAGESSFMFSPLRSRTDLIRILDARIEDPQADVMRAGLWLE